MQPFEPLSSFEMFPTYATRAEAAAAGLVVKDWNPARRPKYWADDFPTKDFDLDGVPMIIYPRAFFGKLDDDEYGVTEPLVLSVEEAGQCNIPPTGTGQTNVPGADKSPRPVPLLPLGDRQRIMRPGPFAGFQVRNLDVPLTPVSSGGFTQADRDKLNGIATKLGV